MYNYLLYTTFQSQSDYERAKCSLQSVLTHTSDIKSKIYVCHKNMIHFYLASFVSIVLILFLLVITIYFRLLDVPLSELWHQCYSYCGVTHVTLSSTFHQSYLSKHCILLTSYIIKISILNSVL